MILRLWDSRAKDQHWVRRQRPLGENMAAGEKNMTTEPLVDREKISTTAHHTWFDETICKGNEERWNVFWLHMSKISCDEHGEGKRYI